MSDDATILIIDDDPDIRTAGKLLLKRRFNAVLTAETPEALPQLMAEAAPDVILLDMNFGPGRSSGEEGLEWIGRILSADPDAAVVAITAHGGVQTAVAAIKAGAIDFVAKPWQNEKLTATVAAAVTLRASRRETRQLQGQRQELTQAGDQAFLGQSPAMARVFQMIDKAGPTDATVLILGENGTGKELAARALHDRSARKQEIFLSVDLGAVTESLFESELFGHKKGAFTGAASDRAGRFVAASGGTLFLDEIGNLPLHQQAKLLTALEQRCVVPVGSDKPAPFDVRVIAATNQPISWLSDPSHFRQDLLFRLKTVELTLPPLRDRPEDIALLAEHFLRRFERKYQRPEKPIGPDLHGAMLTDPWPGNVRALRHAAERAVIMSGEPAYTPADFSLGGGAPTTASDAPRTDEDDLNLERIERRAIEQALDRHRYNISKAAKDLGLTRATLYRRMEKHGL